MAKPALHDVCGYAGGQHERRHGVPQSMEFDPSDAGSLDQALELPLPDRVDL
jgi:hypothetical protein